MKNKDTHEGTVIECLRDAKFRVKLNSGRECLSNICGKMRRENITITLGDTVEVIFTDEFTNIGIIQRVRRNKR